MRKTDGFTLLEVLVAMAILSTALIILLQAHAGAIRISDTTRKATIAASLARDLMTEFELQGYPSPGNDSGDFEEWYPELYPNYRWEIEVMESIFWSTVREVYVKVIWDEAGQERSVELAQFIAALDEEQQDLAEQESSNTDFSPEALMGAYEQKANQTQGGESGGFF